MVTIRLQPFLAGMLLALPGGPLFAQREAPGFRPRRGGQAPADTSARSTQAPTAKPRTEPPRLAEDSSNRAIVRGAVRNSAGEPASGATVWLVVRDGEKFAEPITSSSGDEGQFSFADVDGHTLPDDDARSVMLVARDAEGRLGWLYLNRARFDRAPNEISLTEVADLTGRVVDAEGRPIAGAKLKPRSVYVSRAIAERVAAARNDRPDFFPDLADQYQATTAADGTFKLSRLPRDSGITFDVSVPDFDKLRVVLDSGRPATLRLARPGSVAGRVAVADGDLAAAEGLQLQIDLQPEAAKNEEASIFYRGIAPVGKAGAFRFDGLPPGNYVISSVERQNVPLFAEPSPPVEVAAGEQVAELTLPLKKAQPIQGAVIDAQTGAGIEGVEVRIDTWTDAPLAEARVVNTDAEGRFSAWVPPGPCRVRVAEVPEQYLVPPPTNTAPRDVPVDGWPTISLNRGVTIEGTVVDELGEPVPGAEIVVSGSRSFSRRNDPLLSDRSGKFKLSRIDPADSLAVRARTATMASDGDVPLDTNAAEPLTVVVSQNTACWASGQVVNEEAEPLPNARIALLVTHLVETRNRASSTSSKEVIETAADGIFESPALWPGDYFRIEITCPGFSQAETVDLTGQPGMIHDFGPIVLRRTLTVEVAVVDEMGRGVPHSSLYAIRPASVESPPGFPLAGRTRRDATASRVVMLETDDTGKQSVALANPSGTLSIWARSATAVSDGAVVTWGPRLMQPVRIVVADTNACRLAGRVIDRRGQPVPEANVKVIWDRRPTDPASRARAVGRNGPVGVGACLSVASGAFRSDALWPGEHYHVAVSADGFDQFESPMVLVEAGETADLGTLSPRRCDLAIAGRVLDTAGKPVEGATVVNSGDAREPLQTTTDAEGRFRLEGLFEGPVYALVRMPGFRPAGLRAAAGDDALVSRLTADDQPWRESGSGQPLARAPSAEEQRLVARLLPELWKLHDRIDEDAQAGRRRTLFNSREPATKIRLIRAMARIDLAQALSWSAADGGTFDDEARLAAAERIADDNVDEALALVSGIDTSSAQTTLRTMARRRRLAGANDEADRLLRTAAGRATPSRFGARQVPAPEDAASKARSGSAAIRAGDYERGSRLIEEAAEEVEGLNDETSSGEPHATVITELAAISPKRAIRLWEAHLASGKASDSFMQLSTNAAVAMAPVDMREARRLLRLLDGQVEGRGAIPHAVEQTRLKIAYQIAAAHPDVAIELVEEIAVSDARTAADAFGWLATVIAPSDERLANQLTDRAFELFTTRRLVVGADFTSPPVVGARQALHAQAAGYPDIRGAVDRALAMRITPGAEPAGPFAGRRRVFAGLPVSGQRSPAALVESTVNTALLLAMVDRDVARELLLSAAPYAHFIGQSGGETRPSVWLQAWALTDLARAEELFREALAKERSESHPELIESGLLPMLELLAEPPADRVRFLLSGDRYRYSYYWFPEE